MKTTEAHPLDGDAAPMHEPRVLFAAAAVRVGIIRAGNPLEEHLVDYALEIVSLAARIADRCPNPSNSSETAGDLIRMHFFNVRSHGQ